MFLSVAMFFSQFLRVQVARQFKKAYLLCRFKSDEATIGMTLLQLSLKSQNLGFHPKVLGLLSDTLHTKRTLQLLDFYQAEISLQLSDLLIHSHI